MKSCTAPLVLPGFEAIVSATGPAKSKPDPTESVSAKVAHVRGEVAKGQVRPHHCHARDCETQVPPAYFMCAKHWRMVPKKLQALVWEHYAIGQEKGEAGVSEEYLRVTDEAIRVVAEKEAERSRR